MAQSWHGCGTNWMLTCMPPSPKPQAGRSAYLKSCNPVWNAVGRVTFHLAENKRNPAYPFAFLATYTHRISEQGKVQHLPLGRALEEYAGAKNRAGAGRVIVAGAARGGTEQAGA